MRMNYYDILGVPRDASQEDIKRAFRKLAMQHHPDKGGDPNEFQKINEAYNTLGDIDKRLQYDNPTARPQFQQGPAGFNFSANGFDFTDLFSQIFGHQPNRQHTHQQIFRTRVSVSLQDAYNGADHTFQLSTSTGVKVIHVKVPKGVNSGDQVRYENVLDNGTLIVEFLVMPDLRFDRNGNDLYCNIPVSVLDLIVGTKIQFTAITGKTVEATIPPNTQPTQHIRLQGLGMPVNRMPDVYGDQILLIKPYIPDNIHSDIIESIKRNQVNN